MKPIIDSALLALLVCPETRQKVVLADPHALTTLNGRIASGDLVNRGGSRVTAPAEGALIREDGRVAYLVVDGIPDMLVEEGILLEEVSGGGSTP